MPVKRSAASYHPCVVSTYMTERMRFLRVLRRSRTIATHCSWSSFRSASRRQPSASPLIGRRSNVEWSCCDSPMLIQRECIRAIVASTPTLAARHHNVVGLAPLERSRTELRNQPLDGLPVSKLAHRRSALEPPDVVAVQLADDELLDRHQSAPIREIEHAEGDAGFDVSSNVNSHRRIARRRHTKQRHENRVRERTTGFIAQGGSPCTRA